LEGQVSVGAHTAAAPIALRSMSGSVVPHDRVVPENTRSPVPDDVALDSSQICAVPVPVALAVDAGQVTGNEM
jgi:hypothetical protein